MGLGVWCLSVALAAPPSAGWLDGTVAGAPLTEPTGDATGATDLVALQGEVIRWNADDVGLWFSVLIPVSASNQGVGLRVDLDGDGALDLGAVIVGTDVALFSAQSPTVLTPVEGAEHDREALDPSVDRVSLYLPWAVLEAAGWAPEAAVGWAGGVIAGGVWTDTTDWADALVWDEDGDGAPYPLELVDWTDPLDADTDDDGVPDGQDPGPLTCDTDQDGVLDPVELGITSFTEDTAPEGCAQVDADPLTTSDPTDADSDDGGKVDGAEDVNGNGQVDPWEGDPADPSDDLDQDGDGRGDAIEGEADPDGDGLPAWLDTDADGDGLADAVEPNSDVDGDGLPGFLDADSDDDGLGDRVEGWGDADGDGVPNAEDLDADGDGLLDADEGTDDLDGDDLPNFLDSDSDGDGWPDAWEGLEDGDCDGLPDAYDPGRDDGFCDTGLTPPDVDEGAWDDPLGTVDPYDGSLRGGGGCRTVGGPVGWLGLVGLGAALLRRRRALGTAAVLAATVPAAHAGETNLVLARPAVDGAGLERIPSPRIEGTDLRVGLWLTHASRLAQWGEGETARALLGEVSTAELAMAADVSRWVRVGGRVPVHLVQGEEGTAAHMATGDLTAWTRLGLAWTNWGQLAATAELELPSGAEGDWVGLPALGLRLGAVGALTPVRWVEVRAEAGAHTGRGADLGGQRIGPTLYGRLGVLGRPLEALRLGLELDGDLAFPARGQTDVLELLGSVEGDLGPRWSLRLMGGGGLTDGIGSPRFSVGAGLIWTAPPPPAPEAV